MDLCSAHRAIGMRSEPCIDALGVEDVVAVREDAPFLAFRQLRQADRALRRRAAGGGGQVSEGGKEVEKGRV